METLTVDRTLQLLREAVAEKGPDFVYKDLSGTPADSFAECRYVHGDEPGCLVGNVLFRHGIPLVRMQDFEGEGAGRVVRELVDTYESPAPSVLVAAQETQDSGGTWGEALDNAERAARQYAEQVAA